ncbi:MAG: hypothetical protein DRQ39_11515, partial [Gammaproteobacteria bacterium]
MKAVLLQESFAAGEISPDYLGRFSDPIYKSGLKTCVNAITSPRGIVTRRSGSRIVHNIRNTNECKLFTFHYDRDESFAVAITDGLCTVIEPDAEALGIDAIVNGEFNVTNIGWEHSLGTASKISYDNAYAELIPGTDAGGFTEITQIFTVLDINRAQRVRIEGLFTGDVTVIVRDSLGVIVVDEIIARGSKAVEYDVPEASDTTLSIIIKALPYDQPSRVYRVSVRGINLAHGTWESPAGVVPYKANDLKKIHATMSPSGKEMYFTHPDYPPHKLSYDVGSGYFAFTKVHFNWTLFDFLNIDLTVEERDVEPDGALTYRLNYFNSGGEKATGVVVEFIAEAGTVIVDASHDGVVVDQTVKWDIAELIGSSSVVLTVNCKADPLALDKAVIDATASILSEQQLIPANSIASTTVNTTDGPALHARLTPTLYE